VLPGTIELAHISGHNYYIYVRTQKKQYINLAGCYINNVLVLQQMKHKSCSISQQH